MVRAAILRLGALVLVSGLTGSVAFAQDEPDCANATAQQDVNYCLALANQDIGKQLQAAYEAELANAEEGYAEVPENLAKVVDALKVSQAAFVTYMKNQCASEGYMALAARWNPSSMGNA